MCSPRRLSSESYKPGQLDAGFFYGVEAAAAHIKTVPLTGTSLAGDYTITILNKAPHEAAAVAFVNFLARQGRPEDPGHEWCRGSYAQGQRVGVCPDRH